jgi:hypothetical protein
MRVRIALAVGMLLTAVAVVVTLSRSPLVLARANPTPVEREVPVDAGNQICQGGETLPRGTAAVRLAVTMALGARVTAKVMEGSRVLASGSQAAGWRGHDVTVPIKPLAREVRGATVCFHFGATNELVGLIGAASSASAASGRVSLSSVRIEYLRREQASWWSQLLPIARRMGLGHAPSGSWIVLLIAALMTSALSLACWRLLVALR